MSGISLDDLSKKIDRLIQSGRGFTVDIPVSVGVRGPFQSTLIVEATIEVATQDIAHAEKVGGDTADVLITPIKTTDQCPGCKHEKYDGTGCAIGAVYNRWEECPQREVSDG